MQEDRDLRMCLCKILIGSRSRNRYKISLVGGHDMKDFIIGIICGMCLLLTAWNTYILKKPKKPVALTDEEKRKADDEKRNQQECDELMNYKGRNK